MADITRRRQGEMLHVVFKILAAAPEGLAAHQVISEAEKNLVLTEFEMSDFPNSPGTRRFDKIIRFTTISPVKAGWLIKDKGTWTLTDEGRAAMAQYPDPEMLMKQAGKLYKEWKKAQPDGDGTGDGDGVSADTIPAATTVEEAEDEARGQIRDYLVPPYDFQELVAALLRAMDYHIAWIAPPGPDRGIDIVAYTDPLGASGPRIKVQVKRRNDKIAVHEVRSFMAVLSSNDVGIFISTGGFTSDAYSEARQQENRRLSLLGLDEVLELWTAHYGAIPEQHRALLPLKPVYFLAPT